ncbi:hypothetical protein ACS0TY_006940 [Phlomoides rotata]
MAAYAALVSLLNNMEQIRNHPRLSTSFDRKQMKSLLQRLDFLLDFIESYNSYGGRKEEAQDLEMQIASAAHAAEDVIESYIVDEILAGSIEEGSSLLRNMQLKDSKSCPERVMQDLRKIMEDMDSIKEKVMKVKEVRGCKAELPYSSISASSSTPLTARKSNMVGFDGYLIHLLEELTGHQTDRKIIPIVGMGGIGKTTLARNTYDNLLVVHHFDVRAWVTVSQGYNVRGILFETLSCLRLSNDGMNEKTEHDLGEQLYKNLSGMRYLIILDDMWSIEVWDEIKKFFPNNFNSSRILVTSRISDIANHFGSVGLALNFLDDDQSWNLFCEKVFPDEVCPPELEESGKKIVKKCKGLPLAIVVIGGLLVKSSRTQDQWENVEKDVRSILNTAEDNRCSKLLILSYSHLPACLKPCFLYLRIFPEDEAIRVSRLVKLWVAEGFIRPSNGKSLEEIAEGYIEDLVDRNLISVDSLRCNGKFKACGIHDLVRELCISIAEKEKFLCATGVLGTPQERQRRIIIHGNTACCPQLSSSLNSKSLARSLISKGYLLHVKSRLLRVLIEVYGGSADDTFQQVNLRFLAHETRRVVSTYHLPSSISLLWNVQTLIMKGVKEVVAPHEIWKMPQLRHLKFNYLSLPDPPPTLTDGIVLHNLQTLGRVVNFRCSKEASKRMPNIKKLGVFYDDFSRKVTHVPEFTHQVEFEQLCAGME